MIWFSARPTLFHNFMKDMMFSCKYLEKIGHLNRGALLVREK